MKAGRRAKLVDVAKDLKLDRLELLSMADRDELPIWVLPGKVKRAEVQWMITAQGSSEERGGKWSRTQLCGRTAPDGKGGHLFGGRSRDIPFNPEFLRVDVLAAGDSFRDLEAGCAVNAKGFTAPLAEPVERDDVSFTVLDGVTHGEPVALGLDDLYIDAEDLPTDAAPLKASTWRDDAVRRARGLIAADPINYTHEGSPNVSKLADALTANPPLDGGARIHAKAPTVRKFLTERRPELV